MSRTKGVAIAGSTGSIGTQAVEVATATGAFDVVAIGARSSVELLAAQARELSVKVVALADESRRSELEALLPSGPELRFGEGALSSLADDSFTDVVLNAVVGFAGLDVTISALSAGKRLALANKESLIAGAPVVKTAKEKGGGEILPVDSEHCAIHQCLSCAGSEKRISRIILTASGGPFRGRKRDELESVSLEEALAHPTWSMGPKITIDSSTLMNKGLEVLEAKELFGVEMEAIEVVVHPQSIVHSMVEFADGATIAQLSRPDMRLPIGYCLGFPERLGLAYGSLDWSTLSGLDFASPDYETFSCLGLAFEAGRLGGAAPAWLNAANEVAVAGFLEGRVSWLEIAEVVEATLQGFEQAELSSVEAVLEQDALARERAAAVLEGLAEAS